MRFLPAALVAALAAGCTTPHVVLDTVRKTEETLGMAHRVYAPLCAPEPLANAESNLDFTRIELHQGFVRRASEHVEVAYASALEALTISTPCGGVDRDRDTIADIVDRCPDEKEDFDGVMDEDGCRDVDPNGDEDGDGIVNVDDACPDQPEDLDGDNDGDGCPETSEDRDGDGIIDAVDACDDQAEDVDGFKDTDGCPDPDNDDDLVPDFRDGCPMIAEDRDDWEDEDGCPEPDNDLDTIPDVNDKCPNEPGDRARDGCPVLDADGDGIADVNDQCPTEPETPNQYLDEDGCPDQPPSRVKVTRTQVEIKEVIQFETGSAKLLPASDAVLDDVAQVLKDASQMKLRIEGHTDSDGSEDSNLRLSQQRADAVRDYLLAKGVAASRLQATGFGETKPIDTNRTSDGKAKNRRVEFHIVRSE